MIDKWICTECRFVGMGDKFDKVKDPRGPDTWNVCPQCRTPEHAVFACDEPGCNEESSCGFPTDTGYRRTCFRHSIFKRKNA
jgi:hypothetical protein